MIVSTKKILLNAQQGKYAVGAFNFNNLEFLQAIVRAAEENKAAAILSTSEGALKYAGLENLYCLFQNIAKKGKVPLALHLDHGKELEVIKQCIAIGYNSVMFDGSHLSFEENAGKTKQVVNLAQKRGVSVEAELGTIGGKEDLVSGRGIIYTNPSLVKEFVEKTGCDFLAVAIGTSHGAYKFKGKPHLNLKLLDEVRQKVKIPLVLHGASGVPQKIVLQANRYGARFSAMQGVPDEQLKKAVALGICKVNEDTDLRLAFNFGVREYLAKNRQEFDPRPMLNHAKEKIAETVGQRIRLLRSAENLKNSYRLG